MNEDLTIRRSNKNEVRFRYLLERRQERVAKRKLRLEQEQARKQAREQAWKIVGGLTKTSKMPWYSYSIPAQMCKIGAKLAKIPGTVCHNCYALKGFYQMPNVKDVQRIRFASLSHPQWVEAMVFLLTDIKTKTPYFRWHDSGDLQSPEHLDLIIEVARRTPHIRHWLPTREHAIVKARQDKIPPNLTIRLSAHHVDHDPPKTPLPTSTVVSSGGTCPAYTQGGKCGSCRACWDPSIPNVSYPLH